MKKLLSSLAIVVLLFTFAANAAFADYYSDYVTLSKGTSGPQVSNLQSDLSRLGYYNAGITGYFGNITLASVVNYQKSNGLVPDGIVGHRTAREIKVDKVIQTAGWYQGVPYVWGGSSPSGFDCSGFVQYVMQKNGITLPRVAKDQYKVGAWVQKNQLIPGDLVFFTTYAPGASHVGIYIGNGKFIQASTSKGVIISELSNSYYASHYIGAKRVIW